MTPAKLIFLVVVPLGIAVAALVCAPAFAKHIQLRPSTAFRDCKEICPLMVTIPSGKFQMGQSTSGEVSETINSETDIPFAPRHLVAIDHSFALAKYDVTRAQFSAFVKETGYHPADDCIDNVGGGEFSFAPSGLNWHNPGFHQTERDPVVCVNFKDVEAYVRWLSRKTHHQYRLPSESEWEYAARSGGLTIVYWDKAEKEACRYSNLRDNIYLRNRAKKSAPSDYFDCSDGYANTSPVGSFQLNAFGLADMLGNVRQLTEDCWHLGYRGVPFDGSPWLMRDCVPHITRGAAFDDPPRLVNILARTSLPSFTRANNVGFRVARNF